MKILIYGLNFPPEITGVGKYTGEMAAYLAQKSCQVRVITSYPYYPAWKIHEGFNALKFSHNYWPADKKEIQVYRCPIWVPNRPTAIKRILHLSSFVLSSFPVCLSQVFWKPDLILCVVPTIMAAPAGLLMALLSKAKSWLHIQDFEIEAAWSLGFLKEYKFLRPLIEKLQTAVIKGFNRISTISENMMNSLEGMGIERDRLFLFPNWVDLSAIQFSGESNGFRKDLNLGGNDIIVLFSGSMTQKQGLSSVIEAARLLDGKNNIHFVLCGDGVSRAELEDESNGLKNIHFLPLQPVNKLNHLLNLADIHLLPQVAAAADLVMPSKVTAILASGRPVIAATAPDTAIGELVQKAGLITPPEDPISMAAAIEHLAFHPEIRLSMGINARNIAEKRFSSANILENFFLEMSNLLQV